MAGTVSYGMLVFCLLLISVTGNKKWFLPALSQAFFLYIFYGLQAGRLADFIGVFTAILFLVAAYPISFLKMWNTTKMKKTNGIKLLIFVVTLVLLCLAVSSIVVWDVDFQPLLFLRYDEDRVSLTAKIVAVIMVLIAVNSYIYFCLVSFLDRLLSKKTQLILIKCSTMKLHRLWHAYYLEGICNGQTYHFKITRGVFRLMEGKTSLSAVEHRGVFGGLYIHRILPEREEKCQKRADRAAVIRALSVLVLAAVFYYYFIFTAV